MDFHDVAVALIGIHFYSKGRVIAFVILRKSNLIKWDNFLPIK